MIEAKWIYNEVRDQSRLFIRQVQWYLGADGNLHPQHDQGKPVWGPWQRVEVQTMEESTLSDIIESGGIQEAP